MAQKITNSSLLNIDFNLKKGLILKWNFSGGLSKNNFYRHLIILDTDNVASAHKFLRLYYGQIKFGDLLAVKRIRKSGNKRCLKWKQKNLLDSQNFDEILCKTYNLQQLNLVLSQTAELFQNDQSQQPLILAILTQKTNSSQINEIISRVRNQKSKFNFIVNVFGTIKNSIDFGKGINYFQFNSKSCEDIIQFYKNYISRIQLHFVEITIECQNGSICCQKSSQWPNTEFNKISKKFYGPHMQYETDFLFFLNSQNYGDLNILLHIQLEYQTLEGRKYKTSKRISLVSSDKQINNRTLNTNDNVHEIQMHKNVWFQRYPFKSQYFVWFKKDKDIAPCNYLKDSFNSLQYQ